ncbi:MAG: hypothetical protein J7L71_08645 [Spirochaetaceae bacterium]|nr:hypothetical protein [Spirochaetaceae bacterium]
MKNNKNRIHHTACVEFKKDIKIKFFGDLIAKQLVSQIEKALPKKNPFSCQVSSPAFTSGRGGSWPASTI